MLRFLVEKTGADYRQWLALTKALIKKDFRESSMSSVLRHGKTGGRTFFTLIFYYLLTGLIFVPLVLSTPDVFMSSVLLITYTMFMIGSLILVEYHSVVISADDYFVLGYQPLSSRTFFLVKLANLLFYVLTFTLVLALPAILTFLFGDGIDLVLGATAFISVFLANLTVALTIILIYTVILKKAGPARLQNILALFQVGLAFFIYSGFFVLPRLMESRGFHEFDFANSPWVFVAPPAWFASYMSIAWNGGVPRAWLLAGLSLVAVGACGYFAFAKLSIGYAAAIATLETRQSAPQQKRKNFLKLFYFFLLAPEERVVARLIRNQFVHDNKFKMAVLGILPLTVFYLFLGTQQGPLANPFVTRDIDMGHSGLLYLLIFLFPMMLRTYVTQSDAFQASWIFYTTPTDISRLVLAEKNFLMIYFVLPFLLILSGTFYYHFGNLLHVLLHILVLGLLSHLFLQFAFLYSPDLPFSRPNVKGRRSMNLAMFLIFVPFIIYLGLPLIFEHVYGRPASFIVFTIAILLVSFVLEKLIKVRVSAQMKTLEFPA